MKYLLMLFPFAALALNPSLPVVRVDDNGAVVEQRQSIPTRYGSTVNYQAASHMWGPDGWRQAVITVETNTTTTAIPDAIIAVGNAYKAALEGIYGEGATTNRELTKAAVAIDLSLREDVSADTGIRLQTWFEILNTYWGKDEVWTFPYGAESYTVTNVSEVWEAVP